ncbi:DUF2934 domain-containing protein [Mesorhizobium erdmanii]|uniref:DUF2934 domain-containing protein n=1 Tax=Mesorhizobium erdmanii TaxID=1777866 RepID=A0A6M7UQ83_9HYPH|nr:MULTISPECIES: DUF2934 domain-containing protein [Mesorhizobium]QKC78097.1 DUF2934 domain-containing protein [Mesorhizobium erdmanii]
MTMTDDRQERIRNRAHQIWQEEGQPAGHHERHWHQAAADIEREDAGKPAKPAKKVSAAGKAKAAPKEEKPVAKASKPKTSKPKKAAK